MTIDTLLFDAALSRESLEKSVSTLPETEMRPLLVEAVVRLNDSNPTFI